VPPGQFAVEDLEIAGFPARVGCPSTEASARVSHFDELLLRSLTGTSSIKPDSHVDNIAKVRRNVSRRVLWFLASIIQHAETGGWQTDRRSRDRSMAEALPIWTTCTQRSTKYFDGGFALAI
jgi:hypothetical protein